MKYIEKLYLIKSATTEIDPIYAKQGPVPWDAGEDEVNKYFSNRDALVVAAQKANEPKLNIPANIAKPQKVQLTPVSQVNQPTDNIQRLINNTINLEDKSGKGKYVEDPHSTRWGISSHANPGVDIKNLSREGASNIYQDKYYKRLEPLLSKFNYPEQNLLFQAGVNRGLGYPKKLLQRVGEHQDVNSLANQMRYDYRSLPKYSEYGKGWENRVTDIVQQSNQ